MNGITAFVRQQIEKIEPAMERTSAYRAPRRQNPRWTKAEDDKLRRIYATQGRKACEEAFAGKRSPGAVQNRCNKLRLVGTKHASLGRLRWRIQCAIEKVHALEEELAKRLDQAGAKNSPSSAKSGRS